jgi:hypothetical protein
VKSARECTDRLEDLMAFVMGELDGPAAAELQSHLAVCPTCRATRDALAKEESKVRSGFAAIAGRLTSAGQTIAARQGRESGVPARASSEMSDKQLLGRMKKMIVTHKRLSAAAAALVALAAGLVLYVCGFSTATAAYALQQTAQANRQIRSCHVKLTPGGGGIGEAWMEMAADGKPLRARIDFPKTEDGAKVVILSDAKAEIWLKDKKSHVFVTEKNALAHMKQLQEQFDPKAAFDSLQQMEKSGKVEISTKAPGKTGEPITLTVTPKDRSDERAVYTVDPSSKLVEQMATYRRQAGQWQEAARVEYLDYNKPIDPKVFHLDLPKDVTTIDQISQKIGLEKGKLTNDEIAMKVAGEFFKALSTEDYRQAGLLLEGIPAEKMKELWKDQAKICRVLEIGKPLAGKHPDATALQVPVTVEVDPQNLTPVVKSLDLVVGSTDATVAKKATHDFFAALIREDYSGAYQVLEKAGKLQHPSDEAKNRFEKMHSQVKYVRIVEIGQPVPDVKSGSSKVPVKIEMKKSGNKATFTPFVRPVYGHPDRWGICGGI